MFGRHRRGDIKIPAPLSGRVIPLTRIGDAAFSEGLLGRGAAIAPDGGRVLSPVSGTVTQMFDTGHAVSLTSDGGVEMLIHVGLDTVKLRGRHYAVHVRTGDIVKPGDLLMEFDTAAIAREGFDTVTPVVICNPEEFASIDMAEDTTVREMEDFMRLRR